MMSGPRIKGFREGWALKVFSFGKAHYFRRDGAGLAVALCGAQDAPAGWLLEAGNWKRCSRCERVREGELKNLAGKRPGAAQDARGGSGGCEGKGEAPAPL